MRLAILTLLAGTASAACGSQPDCAAGKRCDAGNCITDDVYSYSYTYDEESGEAPEGKPEYSCSQCADFAANVDMMAFAGDCMAGPTEACCSGLISFQIEPCVHVMMDTLPPQFLPMVNDILAQCSLTLPAKCPSAAPATESRELPDVKPKSTTPEFSCSQCAEFGASMNIMAFAGDCMAGASEACCGGLAPFQVEPCVHVLMDALPAQFAPMVTDILDSCSLTLPAKCPSAPVVTERDTRDTREERPGPPSPAPWSALDIVEYGDYYAYEDGMVGSSDSSFDYLLPEDEMFPPAETRDVRDEREERAPEPKYTCSQCAEFTASVDMMSFAGDCMAGPTEACCGGLASFKVEPCVHAMIEGMPQAYAPMVRDLISQCSITLPPKCGPPAPKPKYACSQCAEFTASVDMMAFAGDCMAGPTEACCGGLVSFKVEPCVHAMMAGMPQAYAPMVQDILTQCSITLPAKCPAPRPAVTESREVPCNAANEARSCPVARCMGPDSFPAGCEIVERYASNRGTCCPVLCNYELNGKRCEPKPVPQREDEMVMCPMDMKTCSDGTMLSRDAACNFPECPADSDESTFIEEATITLTQMADDVVKAGANAVDAMAGAAAGLNQTVNGDDNSTSTDEAMQEVDSGAMTAATMPLVTLGAIIASFVL